MRIYVVCVRLVSTRGNLQATTHPTSGNRTEISSQIYAVQATASRNVNGIIYQCDC